MEEEIRAEFEASGFSIGGGGPEDAAKILSTRKHKSPLPFISSFSFSCSQLVLVVGLCS